MLYTLLLLLFFVFALGKASYAYIDPGTLGVVYQVGYLIFYGIVGIFLFFFRPIKALFLKIIGREPHSEEKKEEKSDTPNPTNEEATSLKKPEDNPSLPNPK